MFKNKQRRVKIFRITGGLGNQMCQYAFFYQTGKLNDSTIGLDITSYKLADLMGYNVHNGYELDKIFGIKKNSSLLQIIKAGGWRYYLMVLARKIHLINKVESSGSVCVEKNPYDYYIYKEKYQNNDCTYFQGFFEHFKYYEKYMGDLREIFTFPNYEDMENKKLAEELRKYNSVGIHLRRNDSGEFFHNGYVGGLDYYKNAIFWIKSEVEKPKFYVFSNDPDWCKEILDFEDATYISHNKDEKAFRDMQLLSECKYQIIANSTFSLWSGLLKKQKEGKVICPKIWNRSSNGHPAPLSWIRI